jgi:leukotriene-A4 hydrolase
MTVTALPQICPNDPSSYANTHEIKTTSLHLDLAIDFTKKVLHGSVLLNLKTVSSVSTLVLDSSYIIVSKVSSKNVDLKFTVFDREKSLDYLGSPVVIELDQAYQAESAIQVKVFYSTTSECTALQWYNASLY